ncbi:MAG: diguanylate cyclase [Thiobacillus sp.]|nr:diguanylate cyclase [Thiobacillus sp.]MDP2056453.1 diguanylate cyclase [Thiobacillus sp.]
MPLQRGFSLTTGTAFIVLIALIFGLALNGLLQLQALGTQMRTVVEHHNRKIDLITQTQVAAHIRTDSLFRMALADDPFERDTYFMEFNHAGFLVVSGRNALRQTGFTPDEQRSFDAQTRLVNDIQTAQHRVIDLLNAERSTEARRVLVLEAIPIQEAFNRQLADMRNLYQQANLSAQKQAQQTYQHAFLFTLAFGIAAIALALLIAWYTLWKARLRSQLIREQMVGLERSHAALHEEATHDPLTGLANRRLFFDRLQQAVRHAHRYGGKVGILYVDLDRFKDINDRHGHHVGDAVLTEVAKRLTSSIRDSDSVARLGGDEFVVLLEEVQGRQDCIAAAHKVEQALNADTNFYGLDVKIAASIGQALYPDDGADEDTLIRAADAAMYRVKSGCESEGQRRLPFQ